MRQTIPILRLPWRNACSQINRHLHPSCAAPRGRWSRTLSFRRGAFDRSERGRTGSAGLTPEKSRPGGTYERLELRCTSRESRPRAAGQLRAAADHFLRVGRVVPDSPTRANAEYDAAAALDRAQGWSAAAHVPRFFRRDYRSIFVAGRGYGENSQSVISEKASNASRRLGEFEALSATREGHRRCARGAFGRRLKLYEKADHERNAADCVRSAMCGLHPGRFEPAVEATVSPCRHIPKAMGRYAQRQALVRELVEPSKRRK